MPAWDTSHITERINNVIDKIDTFLLVDCVHLYLFGIQPWCLARQYTTTMRKNKQNCSLNLSSFAMDKFESVSQLFP